MRLSTIPCLLAALYSASTVLAEALQAPSPAPAILADQATATPSPAYADGEQPNLELRQAGGATAVVPVATPAAVQYPSITTQWVETMIGGSTTWVEIIYTQTFAEVPDQWETGGAGTIGYGTLTKNKRDIVARETGYAQPIVLAIQQEIITQYVRPVTEILIIETITILPNMTYHGGNGSNMTHHNTTALFNSTGNATASMRNYTFPASLDPMAHHLPTGTAGTAVSRL